MLGGQSPENMLAQMGVGPDALGAAGLDLGAIAERAQSMLAANPDLERQLREQLGAPPSPPAGDEEE
jgi:hypothetical protein